MGRRSHQPLLFALQVSGAGVGAFCLLVLAARHNVRVDLTPERAHSLAPATHEVLARLDEDVTITAFYDAQEQGRRQQMARLLERYAQASPRVRIRLRDLDRNPGLARELGISRYNTGVITGTRHLALGVVDEEEITGALLHLIDPAERVIYFAVGHGERDPGDPDDRHGYSRIGRALEDQGYLVRRLEGLGTIGTPEDAAVVIVGGPRAELPPAALDALRRFIDGGGALVFLLDPHAPRGIVSFLAGYGIRLGDDVVVDERNALLGTDGLMVRIPYVNEAVFPHPPELPAVLPEARSLALGERPPRVELSYLASSAEESWADVGAPAPGGEGRRFERGIDHEGPIPVAAIARITPAGPTPGGGPSDGRTGDLAVIGDADFVTNLYVGLLGNRDFFLRIIDVLTRRELHGMLAPEEPGGTLSPLTLTARQGTIVFCTTVLAPPALVILAAMAVALRRRRSGR